MRQVAKRRKMQIRAMMIGKESGFSTVGSELSGTSSVVALRNASMVAEEVSFAVSFVLIFSRRHNRNKD